MHLEVAEDRRFLSRKADYFGEAKNLTLRGAVYYFSSLKSK
jgi:hypothetical protein